MKFSLSTIVDRWSPHILINNIFVIIGFQISSHFHCNLSIKPWIIKKANTYFFKFQYIWGVWRNLLLRSNLIELQKIGVYNINLFNFTEAYFVAQKRSFFLNVLHGLENLGFPCLQILLMSIGSGLLIMLFKFPISFSQQDLSITGRYVKIPP